MGTGQSKKFDDSKIGSQANKVFLVTGANTGLGLQTCKVLASKSAIVVMAMRNKEKSKKAIEMVKKIAAEHEGKVETMTLDLGSLESVKMAAKEFESFDLPLHCLINNAGIMMCPNQKTKDGFESQFGVNHLGHFALTALLFPKMVETSKNSQVPVRIVNLSSLLHANGPKEGILFDDLNWEKRAYTPQLSYGHSKFANVVFTKELESKLAAKFQGKIISFVVHPGIVDTDLTRHVEKQYGKIIIKIFKFFNRFLNVREGALTQLYCATSPEVVENKWGGEYFIPIAKKSDLDKKAPKITKEMQEKLWQVSEEMTGITFDV